MDWKFFVSELARDRADAAGRMSATLPKPPSLIASRTQTISSVSFEEAPVAARQPTTKLPSGSLVRRGSRKSRLDVDANDMNQEAARRSWDAAEALCAVADAASPES